MKTAGEETHGNKEEEYLTGWMTTETQDYHDFNVVSATWQLDVFAES
jgi:hypothetical protein